MKQAGGPVDLMSILHVAYSAEHAVEAKLDGLGLTLAKLSVLRALASVAEPLPLGQLAGQLSCVKSNVTQLVDRLEADGFVARTPDPHDRRTKLATLTAAGRRACKEAGRMQRETEDEMANALTADEARQLGELLAKMNKRGE